MDDENLSCELSIDNIVSIGDSTFLNDSSLSGHLDRIASALLTDRQHGEQARSFSGAATPVAEAHRHSVGAITVPRGRKDFLQPVCNSAVIRVLSPKLIFEGENRRLKKMGLQPREVYNWAGVTLRTSDSHGKYEISSKSVATDAVLKKDPSINTSMKQWKKDSLDKNKSELRSLEEELEQKKRIRSDAQEMKVKFRKSLDNFRQKLRGRLTENQDPFVGNVMRCVDDSMAHHLLECRKDLDLSVDDALALIGFKAGKGTENIDLSKQLLFPEIITEIIHPAGEINQVILDTIEGLTPRTRGSEDEDSSASIPVAVPVTVPKIQAPWGGGKGCLLTPRRKKKAKIIQLQNHTRHVVTHKHEHDNMNQKELSLRSFTAALSDGKLHIERENSFNVESTMKMKQGSSSRLSFLEHNESLPHLIASTVPPTDFFMADSLNKILTITDKEMDDVKSRARPRKGNANSESKLLKAQLSKGNSTGTLGTNDDPTFITMTDKGLDTDNYSDDEIDNPKNSRSGESTGHQVSSNTDIFHNAISDYNFRTSGEFPSILEDDISQHSEEQEKAPKIEKKSDSLPLNIEFDDNCDKSKSDERSVSTISQAPIDNNETKLNEEDPILFPIRKNSFVPQPISVNYHRKNLEIMISMSKAKACTYPPCANLGAWSAPRKKVDGRYIVRHSYVTHTTKRTSLIPGQGINKSSTLPIVPSKPFF